MLEVRSLAWLSCLALLFAASGCGSCKTRGQEPIEYRDADPTDDGLYYETSAAFGEYLHFPPGRTYDLIHGLVTAPYEVTSFIAFNREIKQGGDGNTGNYAESAGNQVVVECQDTERVRVRNDTCAEFYLRVILKANPELSHEDRPCP